VVELDAVDVPRPKGSVDEGPPTVAIPPRGSIANFIQQLFRR
jgi:hypothetical protein